MTSDTLWCTCPDFIQHRLPCKHILSVAEKKLTNLPVTYQKAVEFNATVQMAGQYCASVVSITEQMRKSKQVHHDGYSEEQGIANEESPPVTAPEVTEEVPEESEPGPSSSTNQAIPLRTEVLFLAACSEESTIFVIL